MSPGRSLGPRGPLAVAALDEVRSPRLPRFSPDISGQWRRQKRRNVIYGRCRLRQVAVSVFKQPTLAAHANRAKAKSPRLKKMGDVGSLALGDNLTNNRTNQWYSSNVF